MAIIGITDCNTTSALTTNTVGSVICGAISGSGSSGGNSKWATSTDTRFIQPNAATGIVSTWATSTNSTTTTSFVSSKLNLDSSVKIGSGNTYGCTGCAESGFLQLYSGATGYATLQSGTSYGILLNPSGGNVGIGVTPSSILHVSGGSGSEIRNQGDGGFYSWYTSAGARTSFIQNTANIFKFSNEASGGFTFNTAGLANSMIITNTGLTGIGISPSYKLQVETPASGIGAAFRTTAGTNNPGLFITTTEATDVVDLAASGSSGTFQMSLTTGSTETMRLVGGKVGIGTTTPNSTLTVSSGAGSYLLLESTRTNATNRNFKIDLDNNVEGNLDIRYSTAKGGTSFSTALSVSGANGNVGIATTSPTQKLSVEGNAFIQGVATTTTLVISGITGSTQCLQANSLGLISGTGSACGAGGGGGASVGESWAFVNNKAWLAPTTTVGIIVNASSTIGNGAQNGGLTINGGATTTGTALVSGTLNVTGSINSTAGNIVSNNGLYLSSTGVLQFLTRSTFTAPTDGEIKIADSGGTAFTRLDFGGVTSSYPALQRNTTFLNLMLADGTAGGSMGIATNSPAVALDVNGYVKVLQTSTTTACSPTIAGSIFYNQANNNFWGCGSGSTWTQLGAGSVSGGGGTNFFTNSGIYTYLTTGTNLGIGTTTPYAPLSVMGQVVATNFFATSTTATSTFSGGLVVGNGAIVYDLNTATTTINQLDLGNLSFALDSGVVSALDFPVFNAAIGTPESMSFGFNLSTSTSAFPPLFTIYGESNGGGAMKNTTVMVGSTTPPNNTTMIVQGASGSSATKGTCFMAKDVGANTWTYWWYKAGVQTVQTTSCSGTGTTTIIFD